jgi:hypothetical protein
MKKLNRPIFSLVLFFFCFPFFVMWQVKGGANLLYAFGVAVGFTVSILAVLTMSVKHVWRVREEESDKSWVDKFFSVFEKLIAGLLTITSIFLLICAATFEGNGGIIATGKDGMIMFWTKQVYLFALISTIATILIEGRLYIHKGKAVVINGKVYYPGETFTLNPLFECSSNVIMERVEIDNLSPKTHFEELKDVGLEVRADVWIYPNITAAKEKKLRALDFNNLVKGARESLTTIIEEISEGKTIGEFLRAIYFKTETFEVLGFPLVFNGRKARVHFVQPEAKKA